MDSGAMKAVIRAVLLPLLLFNFSAVSIPLHYDDYPGYSSAAFTYDRFPEIKRHCSPVLPVLAELKPDDSRGERIKNELSFINGDWSQEPDVVPLVTVDKKEQNDESHFNPSTKLVSFWVMDVDSHRRSDNMVSVSGILEIGFSRHEPFSSKPYTWSPDFETSSETTKLTITFEGVYVESDENEGERHMCLLGTSLMPGSDVSLNHVSRDGSLPGEDNQILLLLRYPKTLTLTSRGIYGQMESLATKSDLEYFGKISISSQLNAGSFRHQYQFGSAQVSKACSPYQDSDVWFRGDSVIFLGKDFCNYLQGISGRTAFKILPNRNSFVQDALFGSFARQIGDLGLGNVRILIRNFICRPGSYGINTANVSAEFAVSSDHYLLNGPNPRDSTGLSGISIFAEGIWSSTERELCMVGCLGSTDKDIMCDYRVSIFLPTAFNIHRRSMVYGNITSIDAPSKSDATISFENAASSPNEFLSWANFYVAYHYSKISLVSALRSRHQLASLMRSLLRIVLQYPSYNPNNHRSLTYLPEDLTVRSKAVVYTSGPENFAACKCSDESEPCKIVSVDLLFGPHHVHVSPPTENQDYNEIRTVALSGYLSVTGKCFSNVSLSVEGLYDPMEGTMHLIGCKDLRVFPVENTESLEQGQDCMIEIEVKYPPINARWFLNQKLKISISSQREKQDFLYFSPIVVWTPSITYPWQLKEEEFIMDYEECITFILLFLASLTIVRQQRYMNSAQGEASSSYVSLVMLGIQQFSYFISLIIGSGLVIPTMSGNAVFNDFPIIQTMMLLTLKYFFSITRDVKASRRTKPNSASEIKVLIITLSIHVLGLSIFLNQYSTTSLGPPLSLPFKQIEAYLGLALDFFLLPQIIANRLGQIKSKPLRKTYYIGFSLIRVFPHLYTYYRDPVSAYVAAREKPQATTSLAPPNRFSDIVIAMAVLLLAFVVYIQQRCCSDSETEPKPEPDQEPAAENESFLEDKDSSN